jgi:hypothetical protein
MPGQVPASSSSASPGNTTGESKEETKDDTSAGTTHTGSTSGSVGYTSNPFASLFGPPSGLPSGPPPGPTMGGMGGFGFGGLGGFLSSAPPGAHVSFTHSVRGPGGNVITMSGRGLTPAQAMSLFPSIGGVGSSAQSGLTRLLQQFMQEGLMNMQDVRVPLSQEQFNTLGKHKYSEIKEQLTSTDKECDETCVICQEDFKDDDEATNVGCSGHHVFHTACIKPWLTDMSKKCPTCREDLTEHLSSAPNGEDASEAVGEEAKSETDAIVESESSLQSSSPSPSSARSPSPSSPASSVDLVKDICSNVE